MKFILSIVSFGLTFFIVAVLLNNYYNCNSNNKNIYEINNKDIINISKNIPEIKNKEKNYIKNIKKHIKILNIKQENIIKLFGSVEEYNSIQIAEKIKKMNNLNKSDPIYLLIDSPGGSVIYGSKIISALEASKRPVYTICITLCASMGAIIHSYGYKRLNVDRSLLMFHNASGGVSGEMPRMLSLLKTLDRYIERLNLNIVKRSKLKKEDYDKLIKDELWVDAEDALDMGLTDELVSINILDKQEEMFIKSFNKDDLRTKFDIRL